MDVFTPIKIPKDLEDLISASDELQIDDSDLEDADLGEGIECRRLKKEPAEKFEDILLKSISLLVWQNKYSDRALLTNKRPRLQPFTPVHYQWRVVDLRKGPLTVMGESKKMAIVPLRRETSPTDFVCWKDKNRVYHIDWQSKAPLVMYLLHEKVQFAAQHEIWFILILFSQSETTSTTETNEI